MKCTIHAFGQDVPIVLSTTKYENGRTAVVAAVGDNEYDRWGIVTVNIPEVPLSDGQILVKTWSENSHWVPQLLTLLPKHFKDTGRRHPAGYATAQIWMFSPDGAL